MVNKYRSTYLKFLNQLGFCLIFNSHLCQSPLSLSSSNLNLMAIELYLRFHNIKFILLVRQSSHAVGGLAVVCQSNCVIYHIAYNYS